MKPVALLIGDGWADWESGYLAGAAGFFLGTPAAIVTPDGMPVRSVGGLRASADASFRSLVPAEYSAIALIGGPFWLEAGGGVAELLREAVRAAVPVGGICAGTIPLARAGLLDTRSHTSNGIGYLDGQAPEYLGSDRYQDTPAAVADQGVVTAPGTAPCSFAISLLRRAAPESGAVLEELLAHSAREHRPAQAGHGLA